MDSIIGRNILNCSFRYKMCLDNILNLHFQPRDMWRIYLEQNIIIIISILLVLKLHEIQSQYFTWA